MLALRQAEPLLFAVRLGKASCFCVNHASEQHELHVSHQSQSPAAGYIRYAQKPQTSPLRSREIGHQSELQAQRPVNNPSTDPHGNTQIHSDGPEKFGDEETKGAQQSHEEKSCKIAPPISVTKHSEAAFENGVPFSPTPRRSQENMRKNMESNSSFQDGSSRCTLGDGSLGKSKGSSHSSSPAALMTASPRLPKHRQCVPKPGEMGRAFDRNPVFYLNILVPEKGNSGKTGLAQVSELSQTDKSPLDDPGHGLLDKVADFGANQFLQHEGVASASIAKEMAQYLPIHLLGLGLRCAVEESFRKGGFVVLRISVVDDQSSDLMPEDFGKHSAAGIGLRCFQSIAACCGNKEMFNFHSGQGPNHEAVKQICKKIPDKLKRALGEKGVHVDIVAESETEEAFYVYKALKYLNAESKATSIPRAEKEILGKPSMYVNILVLAKNHSLEHAMNERLRVTNPFGEGIQGLVERGLGTHVTSDHFAAQLAVRMPTKLADELQKIGVTAEAEEAYRHKSFVVVRLTILNCRLPVKKGRKERVETMNSCLECLEGFAKLCGYRERIENKVEHKRKERILEGLCELLPEKLPERLSEDGYTIQIETKSEMEQAAFFFRARRQLENSDGLAPPRAYPAPQ